MVRHVALLFALAACGGASSPKREVCTPVEGAGVLRRPGRIVLVGQGPATREAPAFAGQLACGFAAQGPVRVGLDISQDEQERVEMFLSSEGTTADREELLSGRWWKRDVQDGRSSEAMVDLLEHLRQLRAAGAKVKVVLFDVPARDEKDPPSLRERKAALNVLSARTAAEPFLVLTGHLQAKLTKGMSWDEDYVPMGYHLASGGADVLSIRVVQPEGTVWTCSPTSVCAVTPWPATGSAGKAPSVQLVPQPGYSGVAYLGSSTASLPAKPAADR